MQFESRAEDLTDLDIFFEVLHKVLLLTFLSGNLLLHVNEFTAFARLSSNFLANHGGRDSFDLVRLECNLHFVGKECYLALYVKVL